MSLQKPDDALAGPIRSAIWSDLELNAMIGNGNWLGSLWYNAGDADKPTLHIRDLACCPAEAGYYCEFILFRDGGPVKVFQELAPDELHCKADFERDPENKTAWQVKHRPPRPTGGHSQTSMTCEPAKSN